MITRSAFCKIRRRGSDAGRQINAAVIGDVGRLHDRHVNRAQEPAGDKLRHVRQVHVDEVKIALIGLLAQHARREIRRVRETALASPSASSQAAPVDGAAEESNLKGRAGLVERLAARRRLRVTALGEPAGVKPPTATIEPSSISSAASSAVRIG